MAKILSDREIEKIYGTAIVDFGHLDGDTTESLEELFRRKQEAAKTAGREKIGEALDKSLLNPNGVELRLGTQVRFFSDKQEQNMGPRDGLKIRPGEHALITSREIIDFRPETVAKLFPDKKNAQLMAFISPRTTEMRGGTSQPTTKIDSGFWGVLTWSIRNNTNEDILLEHSQQIFKLTVYLLEDREEVPDKVYDGQFQGLMEIKLRHQPTLSVNKILESKPPNPEEAMRQLDALGPPYNKISKEFLEIGKKLDLMTKDIDNRFDSVDHEFAKVDSKFELLRKDFTMLTKDFTSLGKDFTSFKHSLTTLLIGAVTFIFLILKLGDTVAKSFGSIGDYIFIGLLVVFLVIIGVIWRTAIGKPDTSV